VYELKHLDAKSIPEALERARHYRDLNQPEEAESICRDILDVDANHAEAKKTLGLALTDRFPRAWKTLFDEAVAIFGKLPSEYERTYYTGVAWERLAKALLDVHQTHTAAHAFENALTLYGRAMEANPRSPDPILRWNRCVRVLGDHPELLGAIEAPHAHTTDFGHYE
jgi:tetratricopeptide (TPR) repeat protein